MLNFPPFCPPPSRLAFCAAAVPERRRSVARRALDNLLFYQPGLRFPPRKREEGGGGVPTPPASEERPLTQLERNLYIGFAVWVALTFLSIFVIVGFLHSPFNAN